MALRLAPLVLVVLLCAVTVRLSEACNLDSITTCQKTPGPNDDTCTVLNNSYRCLKNLDCPELKTALDQAIAGLRTVAQNAGCTLSNGAEVSASSLLLSVLACLTALFLRP